MKRIFHVAALTAVLSVGGPAVWAQDFDKGFAAYDSGDYAKALEEWRPLAEQGFVSAQYNLGNMYRIGEGVPQDYAEAVWWYRLGAEQGRANAQNNLAVMYSEGRGVIQDNLYAHMWYNIAASLGAESAAKSRDIMASKMTPQDISKAQAMARECVAKNYKGC